MVIKLHRERFEVLQEQQDEGGNHIRCPRLPGHSEGDPREEAIRNIKDAIEGWLEVASEFHHPIPERKPVEAETSVSAQSA